MNRRNLRRSLLALSVALGLAGCASAPAPTSTPAVPTRMTVNNPIAGIAQMATADVQQGIADLVAAGANSPSAPLPLQDSLTCGNWLLTAIAQAQQITGGLIPSINAKGPYSAFIEGKIAAIGINGVVNSAQTTFIDAFNHSCGAAVAGDVNAITVLLAKFGIAVAVPGGGLLGGLIPVP